MKQLGPIERDLRIDFFRGFALLMILASHLDLITGNYYVRFTTKYLHLGFSDFGEVFIFLSGYVTGIVYLKVLLNQGYLACQGKALHRCAQLYLMHMFSVSMVLGVSAAFYAKTGFLLEMANVRPFFEDPVSAAMLAPVLLYAPFFSYVLPLYIVILAMMPPLLYLLQRAPRLACCISLGVYLAAQIFPWLNLPAYPWGGDAAYPWGNFWGFNPFAWQFLFFCGMLLGSLARKGRWRPPKSRALLWLAIAAMLLAFAPRAVFTLVRRDFIDSSHFTGFLSAVLPLAKKSSLGPIRLVHFFFLAYLISQLTPNTTEFWKGRLARPIILCGQNSLEIFCFGVVLTHTMGHIFVHYQGGIALFYALLAAGWLASTGGAYLLAWKKRNITHFRGAAATPPGKPGP